MFTHNLVDVVEIPSKDTSTGRFYTTPDGNVYPSITTALSDKPKPGLEAWRNMLGTEKASAEMKRAAVRGTAVHDMAEKFLKNVQTPTEGHVDYHISEFCSLRPYLLKIDNILAQEAPMWSDVLRIAGRVDCIGFYKGKLSIIDFKTSTRDKSESLIEDYFLQTTAYALMFEERYGIHIENLVIIMSVEKGIIPLVFERTTDPYVVPLLTRISQYHNKT